MAAKQEVVKDIRTANDLVEQLMISKVRSGVRVLDVYSSEWGSCKAIVEAFRQLQLTTDNVDLRFLSVECNAVIEAASQKQPADGKKHAAPADPDAKDCTADVWLPILQQQKGRSRPLFVFYKAGKLVGQVAGVNTPAVRNMVRDLCTVKVPASEYITNARGLEFWEKQFAAEESEVNVEDFIKGIEAHCEFSVPLSAEERKAVMDAIATAAKEAPSVKDILKTVTAEVVQRWVGDDEGVSIRALVLACVPGYEERAAKVAADKKREEEARKQREVEAAAAAEAKRKADEEEAAKRAAAAAEADAAAAKQQQQQPQGGDAAPTASAEELTAEIDALTADGVRDLTAEERRAYELIRGLAAPAEKAPAVRAAAPVDAEAPVLNDGSYKDLKACFAEGGHAANPDVLFVARAASASGAEFASKLVSAVGADKATLGLKEDEDLRDAGHKLRWNVLVRTLVGGAKPDGIASAFFVPSPVTGDEEVVKVLPPFAALYNATHKSDDATTRFVSVEGSLSTVPFVSLYEDEVSARVLACHHALRFGKEAATLEKVVDGDAIADLAEWASVHSDDEKALAEYVRMVRKEDLIRQRDRAATAAPASAAEGAGSKPASRPPSTQADAKPAEAKPEEAAPAADTEKPASRPPSNQADAKPAASEAPSAAEEATDAKPAEEKPASRPPSNQADAKPAVEPAAEPAAEPAPAAAGEPDAKPAAEADKPAAAAEGEKPASRPPSNQAEAKPAPDAAAPAEAEAEKKTDGGDAAAAAAPAEPTA